MTPNGRRAGEGGFALVLALLAMAILAVLVGALVYEARLDARVSRNCADAARAERALDAVEEMVRFLLRRDYERSLPARMYVDGPGDEWLDGTGPWVERLEKELAPVELEVRVTDESGRINLNRPGRADRRLRRIGEEMRSYAQEAEAECARLFEAFGYADAETAAAVLRDWTDADTEGDYEDGAPGRPLAAVGELAAMEPLARDAAWRAMVDDPAFRDAVTVHTGTDSSEGRINVNTASAFVLETVTGSAETAAAIVSGRRYEKNIHHSPLFEAMGKEAYNRYNYRLTVASRAVRVEAVARVGPLRIGRTTVLGNLLGDATVILRLPTCRMMEETES